MKKRIISLLLVIVMVALTLTGCAFNFSKKNMAKYTEDKDYLKLIKDALLDFDIKITDEFVNDENVREMKVFDAILSSLASKADTSVTKTEGKPGANDLVYYSYYITYTETAEDGTETTYLLSTAKMKVLAVASMAKVQLGLKSPSKDLDEKIIKALANIEFGEDTYKAYKNLTGADAKVANGSVVYISYEREYDVTVDGANAKQVDVFVSHRVVLDENNPFHAELIKKHTEGTNPIKVGSTVTGGITISPLTEQKPVQAKDENGELVFDAEGNPVYVVEKVESVDAEGNPVLDAEGNPVMVDKVDKDGNPVYKTETVVVDAREEYVGTYSSLKIDFVEGNSQYTEVVDTTYDESTTLDKSFYNGSAATIEKTLDVKDKELTYHIFPAFYVEVPEYTAENIINKVFADTITEDTLMDLLFGKEYEDILAIEDEDERNTKLDEIKARYSFKNGEKTLTIAELATELAAAQKSLKSADTALKTAKDNYDKAVKSQADEEAKFPGYYDALATKLASVEEKETLYKGAVEKLAPAKEAYEAAKAASEAAPEDEALKTALTEAEEAYKAVEENIKSTKESLTTAIKNYNDAYSTYKTSYGKVKGTLNTVAVSDETAADATIIVVAISVSTTDGVDTVVYTKHELKDATGIGSLVNATDVAELTYRGSKSEAGKGGAVASQLKAFDAREDLVEIFFETIGATDNVPNMEHGKEVFIEKYEFNTTYRALEAAYNNEIELEINKKIYNAILDSVVVTKVPKRAIKNTYNDMLDTYKVYFTKNLSFDGSENKGDNTGKKSYYNYYNGSFQKYLTEHVMVNKYEQTGLSYKEALAYLEGVAEEHVIEEIKIYRIAELLDVVVDNKEFKEYQESSEYQMMVLYAYYGIIEFSEDAARLAYQFDEVMEVLTKNEKVTDETTGVTTVVYENNKYVGKYNPLTEDEWDEKYPEDSKTEGEGTEKQ